MGHDTRHKRAEQPPHAPIGFDWHVAYRVEWFRAKGHDKEGVVLQKHVGTCQDCQKEVRDTIKFVSPRRRFPQCGALDCQCDPRGTRSAKKGQKGIATRGQTTRTPENAFERNQREIKQVCCHKCEKCKESSKYTDYCDDANECALKFSTAFSQKAVENFNLFINK